MDAMLKKAEFLTQIGEKDTAVEEVKKTNEKTVGLEKGWNWCTSTSGLVFSSLSHEIIKGRRLGQKRSRLGQKRSRLGQKGQVADVGGDVRHNDSKILKVL